MGEVAYEMMHFTKEGQLWHAWYKVKPHRFGQYWHKVYNSEEVCACPERDNDRQALMGIMEAKT